MVVGLDEPLKVRRPVRTGLRVCTNTFHVCANTLHTLWGPERVAHEDVEGIRSDVEGIRADEEGIRADEEVFFCADVEGIRTDVEGIRADTQNLPPVWILYENVLYVFIQRRGLLAKFASCIRETTGVLPRRDGFAAERVLPGETVAFCWAAKPSLPSKTPSVAKPSLRGKTPVAPRKKLRRALQVYEGGYLIRNGRPKPSTSSRSCTESGARPTRYDWPAEGDVTDGTSAKRMKSDRRRHLQLWRARQNVCAWPMHGGERFPSGGQPPGHEVIGAPKANRTLGMLRRNLRIASVEAKQRAYMALVRSTLEYACPVWDPHTSHQVSSVEAAQRRAARYVYHNNYKRTASVTEMLGNLGWKSLQHRRKMARLQCLKSCTTPSLSPTPRVLSRQLDAPAALITLKLQTIASKNNYYRLSFFPRTIKEWNELEPSVAEAKSISQFKTELGRASLH
ncbi:hypothetical protein Bbelb_080710 [Branchiostoma belcheri]|nr:hypothetical protein Bbelb_080710 [Branchiostoma belcheri]